MKKKKRKETLLGFCGVDSGTIIIVDPCYAMMDKKTNKREWFKDHKGYSDLFESMHKNDPNWKKQYSEEIFSHIAGNGIVLHTYEGDGNYPVYGKLDKDGRIIEARIIFKL